MSFRRLRKLAGIRESITDDPSMNTRLEHRINIQEEGTHHFWMDMLEFIYNAGHPVSVDEIKEHMHQLYGTESDAIFDKMLSEMYWRFDDFVNHNRSDGKYSWRTPESDKEIYGNWASNPADSAEDDGLEDFNDDAFQPENDEDVDPQMKAAIGGQINATYTALEFMKKMTQERGGFTENELANDLQTRMGIPQMIARELAKHILDQFRSMLTKTNRANQLAMKPETRNTRDTNMELFRDLERRAQAGDFGKEI